MTHDRWRLLLYGLLMVGFVQLVVIQILAFGKNFAWLVRVGICDAVALSSFVLSEYMKHRKKSN